MPKLFGSHALGRSVLRPLGVEFNFVAIAFTADMAGATDWSFTPSLGERVWLEHIWVWGHPRNAVDFYDQVFFEVYKVTKPPTNKADIQAGENVLPKFNKTSVTVWGLGYGVWSQDFSIGRWFEGPALRFAMYGEGIFTDHINMHAAFRYMKPEV